jgi:hypothetical protein
MQAIQYADHQQNCLLYCQACGVTMYMNKVWACSADDLHLEPIQDIVPKDEPVAPHAEHPQHMSPQSLLQRKEGPAES